MRELECFKNTSPLIHIKLELKKEDREKLIKLMRKQSSAIQVVHKEMARLN
jgi:uncharacterized membrane protein YciS (DUF1049 family)